MKKINWLLYFIYAVVLSGYIIISINILIYLRNQSSIIYDIKPSVIGSAIIFIGLGLLIGTEKLFIEMRKDGNWVINWAKLILLGLPSFFCTLILFLSFLPIKFVHLIYSPSFSFYATGTNFFTVFEIILGYIIITSFVKVNNNIQTK